MNAICGIYKIESPSGKIYIGQSYNIRQRINCHRARSLKDKFKCKLYSSFTKYGFDNHIFSIAHELPTDIDKNTLTAYEQLYLDQYKSCGIDVLNMGEIVSSTKGIKQSEETRRKIDAANTGHVCSPETRRKISIAQIGKIIPRDQVERANVAKRGRKLTEAHKAKIKSAMAALIRVELSAEVRLKMSQSRIGVKRSEESKLRQSESLKINPVRYWLGKKIPIESINKQRETKIRNKINKQNAIS